MYAFSLENKVMVSHLLMNDQVQVGIISKAIFAKTLIDSQYLVSPGQGVQHYEWRFMPMKMILVLTSSSYPFSISPSTKPYSIKVTSTCKSSTTPMAKATGTNKAVADTSNKEIPMKIMKKKKKRKRKK